jgi:hypothetical protein
MCLITPLFIALFRGELGLMFAYRDHEDVDPAQASSDSLNASTSSEKLAEKPSPKPKENKKKE